MKILFDGYWAADGPPSGQMVLMEVLREWRKSFPDDELLLAVPRHSKKQQMNIPLGVDVITTFMRIHPLINGVELPILMRLHGADFQVAQNFGPLAGKSLTLIHDVLFQSNPEWFTLRERAYCSLMPIMGKGPTRVVTTTKNETNRIKRHNPKLRVGLPIGLAVSTALRLARPTRPKLNLSSGNFSLTVGRLNIRKNLSETILGGLESGAITADFPLVIVGEKSGAMQRWDPRIAKAIIAEEVIVAGYVIDAELRWLYENCDFMVFLSLDEGFGLPPVEAVSFGANVLVSDIPVMRENLGEGASYLDSTSRQSIVEGFKLMKNDYKRKRPTIQQFEWSSVVLCLRSEMMKEIATP